MYKLLKKFTYFVALTATLLSGTISKADLLERTPVSPPTEQFIRSVLQHLGINSQVTKIQTFNKEDIENYGANIVVIKEFTYPASMFQKIKSFFVPPTPPTFFFIVHEPWFNTLTHEEKTFLIGHEAMHIILGHINERIFDTHNPDDMAQSRRNENEADREAVVRLKCVSGALAFFKRFPGHQEFNPLAAHDAAHERAAHLQALIPSEPTTTC